ncbi:MAG: hypothetical protein DHS20C04_16000 [Hyphococcus sp.]|nr:MAG: hypothetical protein DHS20C04_16000 [Marinicaulis sp.]
MLFDWQLKRKVEKLSEADAGVVLALLIDMRNKTLADTNSDVFAPISVFRDQLGSNRELGMLIWPYIRRNGHNKFFDIASRLFMLLTQRRDEFPSAIWKKLAVSTDLIPEAARSWERKHNEMLRIEDYKMVPADLLL